MKNLVRLVAVLFITLAWSSCSKSFETGTINRDCTGTYLRLNNNDYLICNPAIMDAYPDGSSVKVKFNSKASCETDPNQAICELYHMSYGSVEIIEIR